MQVGDALDYLIEVTNPGGPSDAVATVIDALPALLTGGSWVCTASGGATCGNANGSGDTLTDTATLPIGGAATYVYSATVQSAGTDDSIDNTATASLINGVDPVPADNTATDTDVIVIFRDGFESGPDSVVSVVGTGSDYVTAHLRIDATLLDQLGIMPVAIASGRTVDGRMLFTVELARFGDAFALRMVTRDAHGLSERTSWQSVDTNLRLLSFAWQSASSGQSNGYLSIDAGDAELLVEGRDEKGRLTQLRVRVDDSVPWLLLIEQ